MKRANETSSDQNDEKRLQRVVSSSSSSSSSYPPFAKDKASTEEAPEPIIYDEKGPFEEFGEDESDSGDDEGDEENQHFIESTESTAKSL